MIRLPASRFPSVTQTRLYAMPETLTDAGWFPSRAMVNSVIFATECSNPLAMKAYRHQKMAMALPASLVARADIHRASVTSQLQRIDRASSCSTGAFFLVDDTV